MAEEKRKRKLATLIISTVLVVAMVIAVIVGIVVSYKDDSGNKNRDIPTPQKVIRSLCQPTDYQQTCIDSLESTAGNTTDPNKLLKAAFTVAMNAVIDAAKQATKFQNLQDPVGKDAVSVCQKVAQAAANDFKRSLARIEQMDGFDFHGLLSDLRIWLSGALTHQQTCLDGFYGVPGGFGDQMRNALKNAMQMTSNGLAIVTEINRAISVPSGSKTNRRLLQAMPVIGHGGDPILLNSGDGGQFPDWLNGERRRRLLSVAPIKYDLIVDQLGSGKYKTINDALKDIPRNGNKTFVLYIKEGVYNESVVFTNTMTHVMVVGDGPIKTRITGNVGKLDGVTTFTTATVAVEGDYFVARDIRFENAAGVAKQQAVALRVSSDMSAFYHCSIDGYENTLYVHSYRQFYRECTISGTKDFIFGDSAAVFQNCLLLVRKPGTDQDCIVTAQGRIDKRQPTGIILQNCTITADSTLIPVKNKVRSYLGRPWQQYSRTLILESNIDDLIQPSGWLSWNQSFALNTLFFSEYNNRGPASSKAQRVKWPGIRELTTENVQRYTVGKFIAGSLWLPATGIPFNSDLFFPPPTENNTAPGTDDNAAPATDDNVAPATAAAPGLSLYNVPTSDSNFAYAPSPIYQAAPATATKPSKNDNTSSNNGKSIKPSPPSTETAAAAWAPAPAPFDDYNSNDYDNSDSNHDDDYNNDKNDKSSYYPGTVYATGLWDKVFSSKYD